MAKILVVDDRRSMQLALKEVLYPEHEVLLAAGGRDALAIYRVEKPDLVLLDLKMPGMRGDVVADRMLALDPHARIVVVTVVDDIREVVRLLRWGIVDFLVKPFEPEELRMAVARALAAVPDAAACSDFFGSRLAQQIEAQIRAARASNSVVLLWGKPGVGKRTILKRALRSMKLGREVFVEAVPGDLAVALRGILVRLDDTVGAVCLTFREPGHNPTVLGRARKEVLDARRLLDDLRSGKHRPRLFVAATVDTMHMGVETERPGAFHDLPRLTEVYVPSPSQCPEDLAQMLRHFWQHHDGGDGDAPARNTLALQSLLATMNREPGLDNVRFVKAVAMRAELASEVPA